MAKKNIPVFRYEDISLIPKDASTISEAWLEKQLRYLKKKKFVSLQPEELIQAGDNYVPGKVVLTFDGGYLSHYQYAFPLLQRYRLQGIFFIPVDLIGGLSNWAAAKKNLMSIDDLFEMKQWGMQFGVLSATYRDLTALAESELDKEIIQSKRALEKVLLTEVNNFAYPYGKYNDTVIEYVRKAGYTAAFTDSCQTGSEFDRYAIGRISAGAPSLFGQMRFRRQVQGHCA